jgi:hypothetical protein
MARLSFKQRVKVASELLDDGLLLRFRSFGHLRSSLDHQLPCCVEESLGGVESLVLIVLFSILID